MVYIFLADGVEEVEAITPIDYLKRCKIKICSVGVEDEFIRGSHNIIFKADLRIDEFEPETPNDMLILPGGLVGTKNLELNKTVRKALINAKEKSSIAAICAAPSILANLNLLDGVKACCYPGIEECLKNAEISYTPVTVDRNIITSRGAGTAQQFSFAIVEYLAGEQKAKELKEQVKWMS